MNAILPARQFPDNDVRPQRFREAGDATLDLHNCDGRVDDCWLGLDPREFELLWQLAERPGERIGAHDGEDIAALVRAIITKLAPLGLAQLVVQHPDGGYYLDPPPQLCP